MLLDKSLVAEEKRDTDSTDTGTIQKKTDKEEPSVRYIIYSVVWIRILVIELKASDKRKKNGSDTQEEPESNPRENRTRIQLKKLSESLNQDANIFWKKNV